jgi:hypothetical protein
MIDEAQQRLSLGFLMEVMIAGCWSIWDQRNDAIFNANYPNIQHVWLDLKPVSPLQCIELNLVLEKGCNHG